MELECKAWLPGSFSAADQFGAYTFGEVRATSEICRFMFSSDFSPYVLKTLCRASRNLKYVFKVDLD